MTTKTDEELRRALLDAIGAVAPDARGSAIPGDADVRDQLELDSMDFLRVLVGLKERLGVDVPEADAPRLVTLDGAVAYLRGRLGQ
ncbi:MAG: hypothetical protein A2138_09110 [Deltaproteobacteria bacterium RBG_16_71_12]|nr:MAG: hypothetical protein A2138_09110 [Deltaproteobacteria bacterium RBG_16_71_12]